MFLESSNLDNNLKSSELRFKIELFVNFKLKKKYLFEYLKFLIEFLNYRLVRFTHTYYKSFDKYMNFYWVFVKGFNLEINTNSLIFIIIYYK